MLIHFPLNESVTSGTSPTLSAVRLESVHVLGAAVAADALDVFLAAALSVVAALRGDAAVGVAAAVAAAREGEAVEADGALIDGRKERGRQLDHLTN